MTELRGLSSPRSVYLYHRLASTRRAPPRNLPTAVGCSTEGLNDDGASPSEDAGAAVHTDEDGGLNSIAFLPSSLNDNEHQVAQSSVVQDAAPAFNFTARAGPEIQARRGKYRKVMRSLLKGSPEAAQYDDGSASDGDSSDSDCSIRTFATRVSPSRLRDFERSDLVHTKLRRFARFRGGPPVSTAPNNLPPPPPLYLESDRCRLPNNDPPPSYYESDASMEDTQSAEASTQTLAAY